MFVLVAMTMDKKMVMSFIMMVGMRSVRRNRRHFAGLDERHSYQFQRLYCFTDWMTAPGPAAKTT